MKRWMILTAIMVFVAMPVMCIAADVEVRGGQLVISEKMEKFIEGFNLTDPIYLACGEDLNVTKGPEGNAWMQDPALAFKYPQYQFVKNGGSWVLNIPGELKGFGPVEANIVQVGSGNKQRWAQLHEARKSLDFQFKAYKQPDGKYRSAFVFTP